jgi:hypothetical protein|tara:strand:+ start:266 stop:457 length:192 start_codon:yes stop_codon:yes gene_type:complete
MARAAVKRVAQAEIRAAKSFLERRGLTSSDISPRKFAMAAKELDKGFAETLKILAGELSGGQV